MGTGAYCSCTLLVPLATEISSSPTPASHPKFTGLPGPILSAGTLPPRALPPAPHSSALWLSSYLRCSLDPMPGIEDCISSWMLLGHLFNTEIFFFKTVYVLPHLVKTFPTYNLGQKCQSHFKFLSSSPSDPISSLLFQHSML